MRPAPFAYHRPDTRTEVDDLLARHGTGAKILAGGQSLVPILNMRLAAYERLIDINRLRDEPTEPGAAGDFVSFGPLVRQQEAERSALVADRAPLVAEIMRHIAHPAIRSRGTMVGSVAHADPAAELPVALALAGGEVTARRQGWSRVIGAGDLFTGPLATSLEEGEWVEEVRFPTAAPGSGWAFEEFAQRSGDYALCGVAARAQSGGDYFSVAVSWLGMGDVPRSTALGNFSSTDVAGPPLEEAIGKAVADLRPGDDIHASAEYRSWLARRLAMRAVRRAVAATGTGG
ncbi:xanthine dehydrogenase family protein subunit M [soil metagenome]